MGQEDDNEEHSLEEAAGYSPEVNQLSDDLSKTDLSNKTNCDNGNCKETKTEEKKEENRHRQVKRIINNDLAHGIDVSSQAGAIIGCDAVNVNDVQLEIFDGNKLTAYEDADGNWKLHWDINNPENEDDFIALCWQGEF